MRRIARADLSRSISTLSVISSCAGIRSHSTPACLQIPGRAQCRSCPPTSCCRAANSDHSPPRRSHGIVGRAFASLTVTESPQNRGDDATLIITPSHGEDIRRRLRKWQADQSQQVADLPLPFESDASAAESSGMRISEVEVNSQSADIDEDADEVKYPDANDELPVAAHLHTSGDVVLATGLPGQHTDQLIVILRKLGHGIMQSLSARGTIIHHKSSVIHYSTGIKLKDTELQHVLPFLPATYEEIFQSITDPQIQFPTVPPLLTGPLLSKLRALQDAADDVYRRNADILDAAHSLLAHECNDRYGTLDRIAQKLLPKESPPTPAVLLACRSALLTRNHEFRIDPRTHLTTKLITIHSKQSVQRLDEVAKWMHQYQGENARTSFKSSSKDQRHGPSKIQSFIAKTKMLIAQSRSMRQRNTEWIGTDQVGDLRGMQSKHMELITSSTFNEFDRAIISFIKNTSVTLSSQRATEYDSVISGVIRATGMYDLNTDVHTGASCHLDIEALTHVQFLQEIGALKPYENISLSDPTFLFPKMGQSAPLENLLKSLNVADDSALLPDMLAGLRHDWGALPVYCVDSATTKVVDDGISVEAIPGTDGQRWIRVHLANPTSRFGPSHPIARMAAHLASTFYAPDIHQPMLPFWLTSNYFSLAADRPVLTVSARIDRDGDILETNIRPGIVHNVVRLTPDQLAMACHDVHRISSRPDTLWVGQPDTQKRTEPQDDIVSRLTPASIHELTMLNDTAKARGRRRFEARGVRRLYGDVRAVIQPAGPLFEGMVGVSDLRLSDSAAHFLGGDPPIGLLPFPGSLDVVQPCANTAFNIVEEIMQLANEASATWCMNRGVPAIYRVSTQSDRVQKNPTSSEVTVDASTLSKFFETFIRPRAQTGNGVPDHWLAAYIESHGPTVLSVDPGPCHIVGLPRYMKITTPLGRYTDLVNHWQIQSALLREASETGDLRQDKNPIPSTFTRQELESMIPRLQAREITITNITKRSNRFWLAMVLWRAYRNGEGTGRFPDMLTLFILQLNKGPKEDLCLAFVQAWGMHTIIRLPRDDTAPHVRPGDHWRCRIKEVFPLTCEVEWEPLELLHRDERSLEDMLASCRV